MASDGPGHSDVVGSVRGIVGAVVSVVVRIVIVVRSGVGSVVIWAIVVVGVI